MTESLSALAARASVAYAGRPGFDRCYVASEQPPVLAFDFTSVESAQQFLFDMEVQSPHLRMEILEDQTKTVLQYR